MIFDNSILVVGNGESRRSVDLKKFLGPIIGCNALHREIVPQHLVCCDKRMADEAVQNPNIKDSKIYVRNHWFHYFRKIRKNKNIVCLPELPYKDNHKFDQPDHWGSGPYAVLIAAQSDYQNIYLIGFDLYSINSKVNNLYKNTSNYSSENSSAVDPTFWIKQISKVFQIYREKKFFIINAESWSMPKSWNQENVQWKNINDIFS